MYQERQNYSISKKSFSEIWNQEKVALQLLKVLEYAYPQILELYFYFFKGETSFVI